jgi:hypothetical protein
VPGRQRQTWPAFLRSRAHAILAADFFETRTLTGGRLYVFAVIEHTTGRIRILGATAHPSATWTTQLARNLVMDLHDAGATVRYLIRDRDSRCTAAFDAVFYSEGTAIVKTGIHVPRMKRGCELAAPGTSAGTGGRISRARPGLSLRWCSSQDGTRSMSACRCGSTPVCTMTCRT